MNKVSALLLIIGLISLSGCESYQKFVRKDLKIPYVYIPPNDSDHPYTLFLYQDASNFQSVCSTELLTGLSEQEILDQRKENVTATFGVAKSSSAKFSINLERADIGALDAKYTRINKIELTLDNGKVYSLPNVSLSEVVKKITTTHCIDDVKILLKEMPGSKLYIPMQLYAYDIRYNIYTEDGVDVTVDLPKELTKIVLGKIGLNSNSTSNINMVGSNLYVGFRGAPVTDTITGTIQKSLPEGNEIILKNIEAPSKDIIYDVTAIVKETAAINK